MGRPKVSLSDSFHSKYIPEPNSGCWLWIGSLRAEGYGQLWVLREGRKRITGAHRASWILHFGSIPDGLQVCHKCDVRCCVNPDHLFLGTAFDNMRDCSNKGRTGMQRHPESSHFKKAKGFGHNLGEKHPCCRLTETMVREIRARHGADPRWGKINELSAEYGISDSTLADIIRRKTWKHVV